MNKRYVFDEKILLHLALQRLRTSRQEFERDCYNRLHLRDATFAQNVKSVSSKTNSKSGEPLYTVDVLWTTPSHNVLTTRYGRIKSVEARPQVRQRPTQQPTVTIKRKVRRVSTKGN